MKKRSANLTGNILESQEPVPVVSWGDALVGKLLDNWCSLHFPGQTTDNSPAAAGINIIQSGEWRILPLLPPPADYQDGRIMRKTSERCIKTSDKFQIVENQIRSRKYLDEILHRTEGGWQPAPGFAKFDGKMKIISHNDFQKTTFLGINPAKLIVYKSYLIFAEPSSRFLKQFN